MWNAVPKVATPIALAAFALGVVLMVVRAYLKRRADLIKLAPPDDRAKLIDEAISDYGIRADNLTREQRFQLVVKGLEGRAARFRISAAVLIVLALLMTAIVIVAMTRPQSTSSGVMRNPSQLAEVPHIPAAHVIDTAFNTNPPPRQANIPEPSFDFHVLVQHAGQTEFHDLQPQDLMASGVDDYVFYAKADTAGYLYIFQVDSSGRCEWFFPKNDTSSHSSGSNPLSTGQVVVVPPSESNRGFFLDNVIGEEHVFAVFSATRWEELEKVLASPTTSGGVTQLSSAGGGTQPTMLQKSWSMKIRGAGGEANLTAPLRFDFGDKTYDLQVKGAQMKGANGAVAIDKVFKHVAAP